MLVIGLTGGIGSGKSQVCAEFAALGVPIIDADEIAHALVKPGQPALAQIRRTFGPQVIADDGQLDRPKLRSQVFSDAAQLQHLEKILHPRIRAQIEQQIQATDAEYVIVCVPLLLERNYTELMQRIVVVDVTEDRQRQRVQKRDQLNASQVEAVINTQMGRKERLKHADDIIDNNGSMQDICRQVQSLDTTYRKLAQQL